MHDITSIKDAVLAVASLGKDGETLKRYQPSVDAYNVALTEFDAQAKRYKEETNGDLLKAATPLTDRKIALN